MEKSFAEIFWYWFDVETGIFMVVLRLDKDRIAFSAMAIHHEMAVGLHKGHHVTKNQRKPKPSRRIGVSRERLLIRVLFSFKNAVTLSGPPQTCEIRSRYRPWGLRIRPIWAPSDGVVESIER